MIRREDMPPDVWASMCTPMDLVLPPDPRTGAGALFVGSWFASVDHALLRAHAVRHIVEVHDAQWVQPAGAAPGVDSFRVAIADSAAADLRPHLEPACRDVHEQLAAGKNVLVHCQQVRPPRVPLLGVRDGADAAARDRASRAARRS